MNNFNVLDPLELYTHLDTILRTTKELCLDDEGIEFGNKIYYTPLIYFNIRYDYYLNKINNCAIKKVIKNVYAPLFKRPYY